MLPREQPPRLEGGRRKELATNLFQITHEADTNVTFVLQNDTKKEYTIKYNFTGSENLMVVPMSEFAEKLDSLHLECKMPAGKAANICQLRVVDRNAGYSMKSNMTIQTLSSDDDNDDQQGAGGGATENHEGIKLSKQQVTQDFFIFTGKTKAGWKLYVQSFDEKNAFKFDLDFSESENIKVATADGFYVNSNNDMQVVGLIPRCKQAAASEKVHVCDLVWANEKILHAEMKYAIDALKLSDRDYQAHLLKQAQAVRRGSSASASNNKHEEREEQHQQQSAGASPSKNQHDEQPVGRNSGDLPPQQEQQQQEQHWLENIAAKHQDSVKFTPAALNTVKQIFDENMVDEHSFHLLDAQTLEQLKIPFGPKLSVLELVKKENQKPSVNSSSSTTTSSMSHLMQGQHFGNRAPAVQSLHEQQQKEDRQFDARAQREQQQLEGLKALQVDRGNWR